MISLALLLLTAVPPARDQDATLLVVKEASARIEACAAMTRSPGSFRLQWDIAPDGVPFNIEAVGVREAEISACLVREVSALRWPRSTVKSHVEVPFKAKAKKVPTPKRRGDCADLDLDMRRSPSGDAPDRLHPGDVLAVVKRMMPRLVEVCGKTGETVWATWAITEGGGTTDVVIEAPYAGTPLGACVAGELERMAWRPSARAIPRVRFPLRLR